MAQAQYTPVSQVQGPAINPLTGQVQQGWTITVKDNVTGTPISAFFPGTPTPEQVNETMLQEVARVRQIAGLNGT